MVFCIIAAYLMFTLSPPGNRSALWGTLILAFVVGLIVANIHRSLLQTWDLRLMMATGGAMSRFAVSAAFAFGTAAVERIGKLPESFKLPWEK